MERALSVFMFVVLLVSILTFSIDIRQVEASGTIYIRADGSIDPSTAPISSFDNVTYAFTDNINDSIIVERDNIVVDGSGHTIQGTGASGSKGIDLTGRNNITNKNMTVTAFYVGICLYVSSNNNSIVGNNITNNGYGIYLWSSSNNNSIVGNNITDNGIGIYLVSSSNNNSIAGNNITANNWIGIYLSSSSYNSISGNDITANNGNGINLYSSSNNNSISGNNITDNTWDGINLYSSSYNSISGNDITANNGIGISLYPSSNNNSIVGNNITNNKIGVWLSSSSGNMLRGNRIDNNMYNFGVDGMALSHFINDIDTSNTVEDKPVYYWINRSDAFVPPDFGYIALINCTRITIQNLLLSKSQQGLLVAYTTNSTITKCNITANSRGIGLYSSSNVTISQNNITDNHVGIYLGNSSGNSVVGNNITNNNYGIGLEYSSDNSVVGNNITGNHVGIYLGNSSGNSVVGNNITNNNYEGILLYSSSNSTISGNNITGNDWGIHLGYSSNNSIVGNNITNNMFGIGLEYSSNNSIYFNNFINNTVVNAGCIWSSNIWNSLQPITYNYNGSEYVNYLGNYWSDYSGTDTNNDGIGDASYNIDSDADYYPLMQPFETYFQIPPTTELIMNEITSRTHALTETIISQNATLNTTVTGDFNATLDFANLEIVLINSGSFAGKGFSKGNWSTNIEGNPYEGSWQGMLFKRPEERKIYLKGMVSGGLKGIVEGFLSESVNGSDIYDQCQATWTISHIGANIVFAKLNLNGTVNYQGSVEYSSELYALQTLIQGQASGYYDGSLGVVLTHVRIDNETNPYYGEGFSIVSYTAEFGSGEGWTYDKLTSPKMVEMNGSFTDPLGGIVSGKLDESGSSRTLSIAIERINIGLPPTADLKVKIWGPERVSPGQTVNYVIEYRNDGLKAADEVIVFNPLDPAVKYVSGSDGAYYNDILHYVTWGLGSVPPKTHGFLSIQVEVLWGLPMGIELKNTAYIIDIVPHSLEEGLGPSGIGTILEKDPKTGEYMDKGAANWEAFCKKQKVKPIFLYTHEKSEPMIERFFDDVMDVYLASEYNPSGKPIFNERNGGNVPLGEYARVLAFSGGTRSVVSLIKSCKIKTKELILISPMLISSEELEELKQLGVEKIVIYQSPNDDFVPDWLPSPIEFPWDHTDRDGEKWKWEVWIDGKVRGNKAKIKWTRASDGKEVLYEFFIQGDNSNNGEPFKAEEGYIEIEELKGTHPELIKEIETQGEKGKSSSANSTITVARDPNIKYGPEGYVYAGQKLDYKVEYENEGEGIAFGVYFTDTLDEDLNASTLEIGPVVSTLDGSIIADPGAYNPSTRTITWLVGEVGPGEGGYANFSAKVRNDASEYTEVINYATVYFPSVPETTRTNAIVSVAGQPDITVTGITSSKSVIGEASTVNVTVAAANRGYFPETFNLTLYANTIAIQTENITLLGRDGAATVFLWNTTGFAYGNYTVWAYAWPVPSETSTGDNTFVYGVVTVVLAGDLNDDGIVDYRDINRVARMFGKTPSDPQWDPNSDIIEDGIIDYRDINIVCRNYGKTRP